MSDFIVEKLTKSVGDKTVFKEISFIIHDLDRIGIIGVNGTGKTTLLDVVSERIADLDGQLLIHDKHEIVVNGGTLMKELGFKPGPDLGRALKAIENAIVDGKLANDKEAIMAFVQVMK